MAMFRYNPNPNPELSESECKNTSDGWYAEVDESHGKLVATYQKTDRETGKKTKEKYIVGEFEYQKGCKFYKEGSDTEIDIINESPGLWYSFDPDKERGHYKYNFHIVPDKSIEIKVKCEEGKEISLCCKLTCISKTVESKVKKDPKLSKKVEIPQKSGCSKKEGINPSRGSQRWTSNHKYICVNTGENEYLLSFNRLWCDVRGDDKHICNSFGRAQFMCYPIEDGHINSFSSEFKLMYPRSGDDGEGRFDRKLGHRVYNAPYDINSPDEEIAQAFVDFIRSCEDDETI